MGSTTEKAHRCFCESPKRLLVWIIVFMTLVIVVGLHFHIKGGLFGRSTRKDVAAMSTEQNNAFANLPVDAVTKATPKGGIKLVAAQPRAWREASPQAQSGEPFAASPVPLENFQNVLNNIAAVVKPAVVHIEVLRETKEGNQNLRLESVGSGIIVDRQGYVLTNYHVVQNGIRITVTTFSSAGKMEYNARIAHSDIHSDLAILKIVSENDFPVTRLGNADALEVGDWVISMGSPLDLAQTVSFGIVSALRETVVVNSMVYHDMIQTDAHINKGNSGGALVNIYAEVVGINTAIYTPQGDFTGVGFAIPINAADMLLNELNIAHHRFGKSVVPVNKNGPIGARSQGSWLGIRGISASSEIPSVRSARQAKGVLVNQVFAKSPAARAGLRDGDIIVGFGNSLIENVTNLKSVLSTTPEGQKVSLRVIRQNRAMDLVTVTTAKW